MNIIIPYTREARQRSKELRKNLTETESLLWNRIRKKQLVVLFNRQFPALDYILDFYCKEIGLAIELDGSSHDNRFIEDANRQGRLERLGIKFLRFTNEEVYRDIEKVLLQISNTIDELST